MTVEETARTATATPEEPISWQARAGARARLAAQRIGIRIRNRREAAARWRARDVRAISPFHAPPASIAELVAYTQSGAWVPGERAPVLEAIGKAYGWLVAIPISVGIYAFAWVVQRPMRFLLFAAIGGFLWLTQGGALSW